MDEFFTPFAPTDSSNVTILFTSERVGMFSIVQEPQYSFSNKQLTKTTPISMHKTEQKSHIEMSRCVHVGLHKKTDVFEMINLLSFLELTPVLLKTSYT